MSRRQPTRRRSGYSDPQTVPSDSFQHLLQGLLTPAESAEALSVEPLAHLDYPRELALKGDAFGTFCRRHGLAGRPDPILPSPLPRHYRTTTRRRARSRGGRLELGFGEGGGSSSALPASRLEPEAHTAIYRLVLEDLSTPASRPVASHLNHVIIRGSYEAFTVIVNLDLLDGGIVRRLKGLGQRLQTLPQSVVSAFVFCDPSHSEYYFEREAPPVPVRLKKLFGPARLMLNLGRHRYALPPTCFAQVNESMIVPMLATVRDLLRPEPGDRLLDLYCGFGLFANDLADTCSEVVGVDIDGDAIDAAIEHRRHTPHTGRGTFLRRDISPRSLQTCLPDPSGRELVVLDPPRRGADPAVISSLASRGPARVVHIFCGVEAIPEAVDAWKRGGYRVARCLPLDMFAGTPNLEVLLLFEPIS